MASLVGRKHDHSQPQIFSLSLLKLIYQKSHLSEDVLGKKAHLPIFSGSTQLSAEQGLLWEVEHEGTMGQQVSHQPSHGAGQEGGSPALGIGHLLGDGDRDMLRLGWGRTSAHGLGLAREACGWEGQGWAVWSWRPAELGTWDPGRAWRGWAGAVRAGGALGALPRSLSITLHTKTPIWS